LYFKLLARRYGVGNAEGVDVMADPIYRSVDYRVAEIDILPVGIAAAGKAQAAE
jgi:hypothetical protein